MNCLWNYNATKVHFSQMVPSGFWGFRRLPIILRRFPDELWGRSDDLRLLYDGVRALPKRYTTRSLLCRLHTKWRKTPPPSSPTFTPALFTLMDNEIDPKETFLNSTDSPPLFLYSNTRKSHLVTFSGFNINIICYLYRVNPLEILL